MRKNELDIFRDPFGVTNSLFDWSSPWQNFEQTMHDLDRGFGGMRVDVTEYDDKNVVTAALPGYNKEDIKVSIQDGMLNISAEHAENKEEKDAEGKLVRSEIFRGKVQRSFYVGDEVKEEDVKATYKDGMLTLEIAKKEPTKPEAKQIAID